MLLRIAGIAAEYNPLHNGHEYHIRKSRECAKVDAIIAVISANFTQRGEPALIDKTRRAAMALSCGADVVLELPAAFSSCNAGVFADAAIDILAATGIVDVISFGAESGPCALPAFEAIADLLNDEPTSYKNSLKKYLGEGYSFVQSRSMALEEHICGACELLKSPNNNLALSYVKRIRLKNYPLKIFAVDRLGSSYHDAEASGGAFASATAIRGMIRRGDYAASRQFMPAECSDIMMEAISGGHAAMSTERLWAAIKQAIVRASPDELASIAEMREGLENRMRRCAYEAGSLESFVGMCASKRYTRGRIQRYCAHLLLGLRHEQNRLYPKSGPQYIRVLGANSMGREILSKMRDTAMLPAISRAGGNLSGTAREIMSFEHAATEIWETLTGSPRTHAEARAVPVLKNR